jgi:ribosomal protein L7/L12
LNIAITDEQENGMYNMHQLDRIENMLERLTVGLPGDEQHMKKIDVQRLVFDLFGFMLTERKIEAIKAYRTLTGMGLKESKDAIESVMGRFTQRAA